jgi:hypothetical protein
MTAESDDDWCVPGAEVEVSWFPEDGESFALDMLAGQAGTITEFTYPDSQPDRRQVFPAKVLAADVQPDGGMATVRLLLLDPPGPVT